MCKKGASPPQTHQSYTPPPLPAPAHQYTHMYTHVYTHIQTYFIYRHSNLGIWCNSRDRLNVQPTIKKHIPCLYHTEIYFDVLWCSRYASSIHKWLRPTMPWSHWFNIWNTQGSWPYDPPSIHAIHILIAKRRMLILSVLYLYETWFHSYCTQSSKWGAPMFQYPYKFSLLCLGTK